MDDRFVMIPRLKVSVRESVNSVEVKGQNLVRDEFRAADHFWQMRSRQMGGACHNRNADGIAITIPGAVIMDPGIKYKTGRKENQRDS